MRLVAWFVLLCACGGQQSRLLFGRVAPSDLATPQEIRVDLKALDTDQFRIKLGNRTLVPRQLVRSTIANAAVTNGTFTGGGSFALARVGQKVTGVIRVGSIGYEIQSSPTGHRLIPRSWKKPRPLHGPGWSAIASQRGARPPPKLALEPVEITVMFAYTKTVLKDRTIDGINGHIALAMTQLEDAGKVGKINARFVAIEKPVETASEESGRSIDQLFYALLHRKDFLDAHAERKEARADILVLLVDKVDGGLGVGTIMADAASAVAVADHHDSLWTLTIPHEIGHIMGGIHEDDNSDHPFEWGHGFVGGGGRTIMTNPCSDENNCVLLEEWSSPARGDETRHDVARVLRETAPTVATFGDNL